MDIAAWLRGLGLGAYEQAFRDNEVDAEVLPELTDADLRELGVCRSGPRKKLLKAIAALRAGRPGVDGGGRWAGPTVPAPRPSAGSSR